MHNEKFWEIVKKFNCLMRSAIEGPNCLDICNGDCCSIQINIPKVLAEEYIKRGYANKDDFIRSNVFSFKLRFDEQKTKCFLFDKTINGCIVHNSGIKPPQCWIYPTNFSNPELQDIKCKKAGGWRITDSEKAKQAEILLKYYIFLCQLEAKKETKMIKQRLNNYLSNNNLIVLLKKTAPSSLAGLRDMWDLIITLPAEGVSLQMKKFCTKFNENCNTNYLECKTICDKVIKGLLGFLQKNIYKFIKMNGPTHNGEYPLIILTNKNDLD